MRLELALLIICYSVFVSTETAGPIDYDYYSEDPTTARTTTASILNKRTKKPKKKDEDNGVYSIQKFYNTDEKIWVYNTTKKSNDTCMVDDIEHTSLININMTRWYFSDGMIKSFTIETDFEVHPDVFPLTSTYNEMRVITPGYGAHYETLMILGEKNDCGVFYMNHHGYNNPGPDDWFELKVWNSSILNGPEKTCLNSFTELTKSRYETYNYTPACQCIFSPKVQ